MRLGIGHVQTALSVHVHPVDHHLLPFILDLVSQLSIIEA
jgi:hypothetical protein